MLGFRQRDVAGDDGPAGLDQAVQRRRELAKRAATFAYRATVFPMLTGTLITIAGFLPVGLAKSAAGEYTVAIFQVVGISLLLSWIGAVVFTPSLGFLMLKVRANGAPASGVGADLLRRRKT